MPLRFVQHFHGTSQLVLEHFMYFIVLELGT